MPTVFMYCVCYVFFHFNQSRQIHDAITSHSRIICDLKGDIESTQLIVDRNSHLIDTGNFRSSYINLYLIILVELVSLIMLIYIGIFA